MYARRAGGRGLTFDFAEGLVRDNLLIVDRETGSVWSQLDGQAVIGPMRGTPLQIVPSMQTTWRFWRERHPDTKVMTLDGPAFEDTDGRPYRYRPPDAAPPEPSARVAHDTSTLGLGLALEGQSTFLPFRELARGGAPIRLTLAGVAVVIHFDRDGATAWAEDESGQLLPAVLAYESGWLAFFPESTVYKAGFQ